MLPLRRVTFALVLLLAGACHSDGDREATPRSPESSAPSTSTPPVTTPAQAARPDVVVRDVATGDDVNLRALELPDRPTLYWFWAPH